MFKIRVKRIFYPIIKRIAKILAKTPITPNMLTLTSFLTLIFASIFIIHGKFLAGGILIFIGGLIDGIDGELARVTNRTTKAGAFLDSVMDRYGDLILLLSFLFPYEMKIQINFKYWVILAMIGTFMTSYVRAKGESLVVKETNIGLIARSERLFILFLACELSILNPNIPAYAIVALAFLTNATALQRIYLMGKQLK